MGLGVPKWCWGSPNGGGGPQEEWFWGSLSEFRGPKLGLGVPKWGWGSPNGIRDPPRKWVGVPQWSQGPPNRAEGPQKERVWGRPNASHGASDGNPPHPPKLHPGTPTIPPIPLYFRPPYFRLPPLLPPTPPHFRPPLPLTSEAVQADREPAGGGGAVEQQLFRPRAVPPPLQLRAALPELPVKARVDQLLRLRGEGGGGRSGDPRPNSGSPTPLGTSTLYGDPRPNREPETL